MYTAVKSLLYNSDVERIYLGIEDDVFPYELPELCSVMNLSGQTIFDKDGPNYKNGWTYMALMRAALVKILPDELDRVLSLDIDTIVDGDISELWELPIDDYYIAGAHEWHETTNKFLYVNVGVTLHNLKKLRDGKADEIIRALNTRRFEFCEQDAINIYCQGYIYDMPAKYNAEYYTEKVRRPKIIHHIGNNALLQTYPDYQKYAAIDMADIMRRRTL